MSCGPRNESRRSSGHPRRNLINPLCGWTVALTSRETTPMQLCSCDGGLTCKTEKNGPAATPAGSSQTRSTACHGRTSCCCHAVSAHTHPLHTHTLMTACVHYTTPSTAASNYASSIQFTHTSLPASTMGVPWLSISARCRFFICRARNASTPWSSVCPSAPQFQLKLSLLGRLVLTQTDWHTQRTSRHDCPPRCRGCASGCRRPGRRA